MSVIEEIPIDLRPDQSVKSAPQEVSINGARRFGREALHALSRRILGWPHQRLSAEPTTYPQEISQRGLATDGQEQGGHNDFLSRAEGRRRDGKLVRFAALVRQSFPKLSSAEVDDIILGKKFPEVKSLISKYIALEDALEQLSPSGQKGLLRSLERTKSDDLREDRMVLLNNLFMHNSAEKVMNEMEYDFNVTDISQLLNNKTIFKLVDVMLDNPEQYRLQLGIIFSQLSLHNIPRHLRNKMGALASDWEFSLKPENDQWNLCPDAEPRLKTAMEDDATVLVNGNILVKFEGKLTGLALRSFTTKEGKVFHEGNWYSPTDENLRETLRGEFDKGQAKVTVNTGTWTLMRPVADDDDGTLLDSARIHAAEMSDKLPDLIRGYTRKEYREREEPQREEPES